MPKILPRSRFGGYIPAIIALLVLVATLLFNLFTYTALASHPGVGKGFRDAIKNDSPVIALYVWAGDVLRGLPGLDAVGDRTAADAAAPIEERMKAVPAASGAIFFGASQSFAQSSMQRANQAMPFLMVIAGVLWWRRPRPVHLRPRLRA